jgi:hypothetical protein
MATFKTFAKRLAMRLESFENAAKVREAAKGIAETIENEIEIIIAHNRENDNLVNDFAIRYLCFKNGHIPATRDKQQVWIKSAIKELKAA